MRVPPVGRGSSRTAVASVAIRSHIRDCETPGATVAAAHVHPYQSERFAVLAGTVGMKVGRKRIEAGPGEVVTVEPGIAHKFWNAGGGEARFVCQVRPAGSFEQLIETMFNLAAGGKTSRKGMPNPLRLAVIAKHHFDDVRLPLVPHALQRAGLALGAPVGRLVGYTATYQTAAVYELEPAQEQKLAAAA